MQEEMLDASILDLVRVKVSITLPEDLLERVDRVGSNRSAFLERAALAYLAHLE